MLSWKEPGVVVPTTEEGVKKRLAFEEGGKSYEPRTGTPPPPPSAGEQKRPKKLSTPKKNNNAAGSAASAKEDRPTQ
jgi:hypothetical protein